MTDDRRIRGGADRDRINMQELSRQWTEPVGGRASEILKQPAAKRLHWS